MMDPSTPDLSVVVVSYNTADLIEACLRSVQASRGVSLELFVVDNASADGGAAVVRGRFPSVRLVENRENRGFGAANNQVLPDCVGRYIVLLNPDAETTPDALRSMAGYMDDHPRVGLAGPTVRNNDGTRQDSISRSYPGQKRTAGELSGLPGDIACVMGACQIVRAGLMRELGGFDEQFFLYGEDQDLCLRIRRMGYEIGHVGVAVVLHHGGKSERGVPSIEVARKKALAEYRFYRKHYNPETIQRIARAHASRERRRILLTRLSLPFVRDRARAEARLQRYGMGYDIASRHLEGKLVRRDTEEEPGDVRKR
jgi:N-acetylglucosaminyl-diphospho-decaprenol L-rhamnosyltransferase